MTIDELLGGKPASSFTPQQIADKAVWRAQREQPLEAALLFEAGAAIAPPDMRMYYVRGAALSWLAVGDRERAWPQLVEISGYDYVGNGVLHDTCWEPGFAERLFVYAERGDRAAFAELFDAAVARVAELAKHYPGEAFPRGWAYQEKLLEICFGFGMRERFDHVAARIRERRKVPRALQKRVKELEGSWA